MMVNNVKNLIFMNKKPQQFPFHLAIPVDNLKKARKFYSDTLGFKEGRSSSKWVDFNFFGHQLVIHQTDFRQKPNFNQVDNHQIPVPHFGVVLQLKDWIILKDRLINKHLQFIIEPYIRFKNTSAEQATMFFLDPSGNALEFKSFQNLENLFKK